MYSSLIFPNTLCLLAAFFCINAQDSNDKTASVVRQIFDISPQGSYSFAFETSNKIFTEEEGVLKDEKTLIKQGQYQYTSPEGEIIRVVYVADENGFHPQGDHLPTPPPIPPLIQKALDYLNSRKSDPS